MLCSALRFSACKAEGVSMTREPILPTPEHKEAVRLVWMSMHIPVGAVVLGALLLSGIFSATAMVWGYGPVNPIA